MIAENPLMSPEVTTQHAHIWRRGGYGRSGIIEARKMVKLGLIVM